MNLASIPYKFIHVWAEAEGSLFLTNPIPDTAPGGAASQSLGFPPITAVPIGAGGIPPNIADFNGFGFYLSAWLQWVQAGGAIRYDSAFQTAIGGYPNGAVVQSATIIGKDWLNLVDNNASNPDIGGANWISFPYHGSVGFPSSTTYTILPGVYRIGIEAWGGAGAGGGAQVGGGASGGQSGGYARGVYDVSPGDVININIGAGGAGGAPGANGTNGGDTIITFGTVTITATGGFTGLGAATGVLAFSAGSRGTPTGGNTVNIAGQVGTTGFPLGDFVGGAGGAAPMGGGGGQYATTTAWNGALPGGGGSGGGGNGANSGGTGANGLAIITF